MLEIVLRNSLLYLLCESAEAAEAAVEAAPGSRIDVKPVLSYSKENRFPEGRMRSRGCGRKIEISLGFSIQVGKNSNLVKILNHMNSNESRFPEGRMRSRGCGRKI